MLAHAGTQPRVWWVSAFLLLSIQGGAPLRKQRLAIVTLSILALLLLLCAGCAKPEAEAITIGVRTSNCQTPFYVADRNGLYEKRGLVTDVRLVPSNTEIIEGMKRGDIQVGSLPVTTAIAAIAQGSPLRIVAMTGRGSDGILVRSDGDIADLQGLRGKRIATIRASILDILLRQTLEQGGLRPDSDVELVYMSKLGDLISALKTGQVDAISNTEPFMTDSVRKGWGHILTYYTASWPDHPCCVVVARDEFIRQRPEALGQILAAHCEAVDWINGHIDEAAQIVVDYLGAFDRELVANTLAPPVMRIDYSVQPGEIEHMAELMVAQGLIEPVAVEKLVDLEPLSTVLRER